MLKSVIPEMLRTLGSATNASQPESKPEVVSAARVLHECAIALRDNDSKRAKARIAALRDYVDGGLTEAERQRCRDIVIRDRMLRPGLASGHVADHFYDLVLRLAFGRPFDYQRFCEVEEHIAEFGRKGNWLDNRPVLEAIDRARSTDVRVLALTRYHLGPGRLEKWFRSHDLDVHGLVIALAEGAWATREHGDIAFTVLRLYLDGIKRAEDRQAAAAALHEHGYLAGALYQWYGNDTKPQISKLTPILRTAYPHGLAPADIFEVFAVSVSSPALVRAALPRVAVPEDKILVIREFTRELGEEHVDPEQEAQLLHLFQTDRDALSARSGVSLLTVRPRSRDYLGRG